MSMPTGMAVGALFLLWIVVALAYLFGLRRVLETRERRLLSEVDQLLDRLRLWRTSLNESSQRGMWLAAPVMSQLIDQPEREARLRGEVSGLEQVLTILDGVEHLISSAERPSRPDLHTRISAVRASLESVAVALDRYNAAASDAIFACKRAPLSLLARAVGLRSRPPLARGRGGTGD